MRGLDDTDREILRLLLADARRPYSDIADEVGLSAPAVSDRIDRLRETGLIRGFTIDVNKELLTGGTRVLVTVEAVPGRGSAVQAGLAGREPVEHVFRTADDRVVCVGTLDGEDVGTWFEAGDVRSYDVRPVAEAAWTPRLGGTDLAPACAECDNTVTREGESVALDGDTYHFCCENCRATFVERYERMQEGA
jgi:DNA-binding Lrp family transcriptional regulator/YHS domain-containing protein